MNVGPILFLQPLALLGLLSLPILWFLLRATPPEPRRLALPSLALMDDLNPEEETPSRTPWWLLLLRILALALAILGFAKPTWQPIRPADTTGGMLIVVDDGWTSAERWRDIQRAATSAVDEANQSGKAVHLLFTALRDIPSDPAVALDAESARQRLRTARPAAWTPDRNDALERLKKSGQNVGRIVWISDGFDLDTAAGFARDLAKRAPTEVRVIRPKNAFAITSANSSAEGARVAVVRAVGGPATTADIIAETAEGASVASTRLAFAQNATTAEALFAIPAAALNRVSRFRIAGSPSAGAVWLWDDAARRPTVGIADAHDESQPLLAEHYYVRKALLPYATLVEKPLSELTKGGIDAIIMGDRGAIDGDIETKLDEWITSGGVLIRFAGPRLAAQTDNLIPTPLRPSSRALGGALAWETPQGIAEFTPDSPFFGIPKARDAVVRQQVLAQPTSDLPEKTWARLDDGTPLVTAARHGQGEIVLFHITADPDWSDLPYTGAFVEMLRRSVVSGGERSKPALGKGELSPMRVLDGFGALGPPPGTAAPIAAADFVKARPGPTTPPGLYAGPGGERALNAGAPAPVGVLEWPGEVTVSDQAAVIERRGLGGWLLAFALGIIAFDILIALHFAGRLPHLRRRRASATAAAVIGAALMFGHAPNADAQQPSRDQMISEAASKLRFAYVLTPDQRLNSITRAGLKGLGHVLEERTAVEPGDPHGVDLARDDLSLYPMIYYAVPRDAKPLPQAAVNKVNEYLRLGGAFVVDTRDAAPGKDINQDLSTLLKGIDAPPLQPAPTNHVLSKSYYLIKSFPGRLNGRLWIEAGATQRNTRRGDGVSGLFIGGSDWAGAWAAEVRGEDVVHLLSIEGGPNQRELAYRFGVNLVMYILTGNYKEDQVHVRDILDRIGRESGKSSNGGQ